MKVRFLVNADISGKIKVDKGEIFEAKEDRGYIIIKMPGKGTVEAPKSEIQGILEVIEDKRDKHITCRQ
ncbi:MAG: hypothetical protein IJA32_06675 [Lachnospiraceae bacterium]|nr:hypothetical protein [Lachnospiraceae bacterium]